MRAFFDTSVLIPAFLPDHPHHVPSVALLMTATPTDSYLSSHSLAELYSALTRMPAPYRLTVGQAVEAVRACARKFTLVVIAADEIAPVLERAAALNIQGGTVYDFLIAACAVKSKADAIYTWNRRHYQLFGEEIAGLLRSPDQR